MNELMQQTLAGLPAPDRRLVREIRPLVDDERSHAPRSYSCESLPPSSW
jgi:hypothetical protein